MTELLTAAQMRAIEQAAIQSGKVTGLELMERAGHGVVEAVFEEWPILSTGPMVDEEGHRTKRAVIVCGPGNNGGDGFVVARLLAAKEWDILISLYGDPAKLPPDAKANYDAWCTLGDVVCFSDYEDHFDWTDAALDLPNRLFVDALFGTGMTRPISEDLAYLTEYIGEKRRGSYGRVVAIDVPTGLHADTGAVLGYEDDSEALAEMRHNKNCFSGFRAISADLTVTFHKKKHGHVLRNGPWMCGKTVVKSIGL